MPTGIQGAIERAAAEIGLPTIGLWAQVPHYVSGEVSPYPAASLALIEQLARTAGLRLPTGSLASDAERTRHRIDAAMSANTDHLAMLRALEQSHDQTVAAAGPAVTDSIPTADELAAEVERFLRDQGDTDPGEASPDGPEGDVDDH